MDMLSMTAFLLMVFCILRNTTAQDLQTTCPAGGFKEGQESQVNCLVNRSFFDTACPSTPSLVSFVFTPLGGSETTWCSTDYKNCATTGTSDPACSGCTCKCSKDTTNPFVYSLTFVPESRYTDGSFICKISCFFQTPATDFTSCEKFPVATTTTAATLATTTGAVPPTRSTSPSAPQGFGGGETGGFPLPVIIGLGVPCFIAFFFIVVLFYKRIIKTVPVGDKSGPIFKIDQYAIKLDSSVSKSQLNDIAQKGSCCCISPAKISVDGFHSLHDGKPKDVPNEQLHVLISIKLAFYWLLNKKETQVEEFLKRDVTPYIIGIVEIGEICIPEHKLKNIGEETDVTIVPPDVNAQGRTVIQIEGETRKSVDEAIQKVKDLIQTIKGSKCPSHDPYCQNP